MFVCGEVCSPTTFTIGNAAFEISLRAANGPMATALILYEVHSLDVNLGH